MDINEFKNFLHSLVIEQENETKWGDPSSLRFFRENWESFPEMKFKHKSGTWVALANEESNKKNFFYCFLIATDFSEAYISEFHSFMRGFFTRFLATHGDDRFNGWFKKLSVKEEFPEYTPFWDWYFGYLEKEDLY